MILHSAYTPADSVARSVPLLWLTERGFRHLPRDTKARDNDVQFWGIGCLEITPFRIPPLPSLPPVVRSAAPEKRQTLRKNPQGGTKETEARKTTVQLQVDKPVALLSSSEQLISPISGVVVTSMPRRLNPSA
jgi:hypothetical protein